MIAVLPVEHYHGVFAVREDQPRVSSGNGGELLRLFAAFEDDRHHPVARSAVSGEGYRDHASHDAVADRSRLQGVRKHTPHPVITVEFAAGNRRS